VPGIAGSSELMSKLNLRTSKEIRSQSSKEAGAPRLAFETWVIASLEL
jgi:hypothetical protein